MGSVRAAAASRPGAAGCAAGAAAAWASAAAAAGADAVVVAGCAADGAGASAAGAFASGAAAAGGCAAGAVAAEVSVTVEAAGARFVAAATGAAAAGDTPVPTAASWIGWDAGASGENTCPKDSVAATPTPTPNPKGSHQARRAWVAPISAPDGALSPGFAWGRMGVMTVRSDSSAPARPTGVASRAEPAASSQGLPSRPSKLTARCKRQSPSFQPRTCSPGPPANRRSPRGSISFPATRGPSSPHAARARRSLTARRVRARGS